MPASIDPQQNQPTMREMPEDRLSRSSAARGVEHVILGLRKDVIEMNLPEYMHSFPNMTKPEATIFRDLIRLRHEIFTRVDDMHKRSVRLQRLIK